jgi:uncharacterized repeat protein (TIGR03803 family)
MLIGTRREIPPTRGNSSCKSFLKWCGRKNRHMLALLAVMGLAGQATAQTFTLLHSFPAGQTNSSGYYTNSDGGSSQSGLILSGSMLYGTAYQGGSSADGTIFALRTDGSGFVNLHNFPGSPGDGAYPLAGLTLSGNFLYGTANEGGSNNDGMVFTINTKGIDYTNLYSFTASQTNTLGLYTNSIGASPQASLILVGNVLYGTAQLDGKLGDGTLFTVDTDGSSSTNLHNFSGFPGDGASPFAGLILSNGVLYGTASIGGGAGVGMVFRVNADGTGYTDLHDFLGFPNDGSYPHAGLILSGNVLYGTTSSGGGAGEGIVFRVNTDGTDYTNLHAFTVISGPAPATNSDGAVPHAGLVLSDNTLYGTTELGGSLGGGTVFAINTDGSGFATTYNFMATATNSTGTGPNNLLLSGNILFGTTVKGGSAGNGTVFSLSVSPDLSVGLSGSNIILSWPTNATGFTLQSSASVGASAAWGTDLAVPVVVNGQYTVTYPKSSSPVFFRLSQ